MRAMASALLARSGIARAAGWTFSGQRKLDDVFGYKSNLTVADYRYRFDRNPIASRLVRALPEATWRQGIEVIEDDNPNRLTSFEQAAFELDERVHIWGTLKQTDVLSRIGTYAIMILGTEGKFEDELPKASSPDALGYLMPYSEEETTIDRYVTDPASRRYGYPEFYRIDRKVAGTTGQSSFSATFRVHWTRVIHLADSCLEDRVFSEPALRKSWNRLDDLDKVTGGGSEAYFQRVQPGIQFDLDPEMELEPGAEDELEDDVEDFTHKFTRFLLTRGVKTSQISGSDVADFSRPADALITQIAGGEGIPKRILVGTERGDLASTQDRSNWTDRVTDRLMQYAEPYAARQLFDRLIAYGYLPTPSAYEIRWSMVQDLTFRERIDAAAVCAGMTVENQPVVTLDEIRDRLLGFPPMAEVESKTTPPPGETPPTGDGDQTTTDADARLMFRARQRQLARKSVRRLVQRSRAAKKKRASNVGGSPVRARVNDAST